MRDKRSGPEVAAELADLRTRLGEAEEVLGAIRNGDVDAVVVTGERGEHVHTLSGADRVYRQLIETMCEGATTLSADGVILYCNGRLAETLGQPLDRVLGTPLRNYLPPADQQAVDAILAQTRTEPSRREINLISSEDRLVPVYLSASRLPSEEAEVVFCLALTDLTEQKSREQVVTAERLARLILEQAAEAIVVCDEQGRITRASEAAQQICDGIPLLRPFAEVFPLRTDASVPFHLAPVLQGKTLRDVDVALDRQGQELDLIMNAGPLKSGQQIFGCVVTLTDITERKRAEEAIRASYSLLAATLDATADGVLVVDSAGAVVRFNRRFLELWRIPEALIQTRDDRQMLDFVLAQLQEPEAFLARVQQFYQTPDASGTDELRFKDGRIFERFTGPQRVGEAIVGRVWSFRDITEHRRAEEALRQSEILTRSVVERLPQRIFVKDRNSAYVFCNSSYAMDLGIEPKQIVGKDDFAFFPQELAEGYRVDDREVMADGKIKDAEERYHVAGKERWVHTCKIPYRNEQGEIIGVLGVFDDITGHRRAEGTLRLQSAALNAAANAIIITDATGTIEWANAAFASLTGYGAEEAIGKNPRDLVKSGVHDQAFYRDVWDTLLAGNVWRGDMMNRRKDGSLYTEGQTITPVRNDRGEIVHFIAIKRDLTEQRQLEAQFLQAQKMETVGRLAGGIAHDFNNLLTVINNTAELALLNLSADDPLRTDLEEIQRAGDRAAVMTRQLLAFGRRQILTPAVLNLSTLVEHMQSMLQRLIDEDVALVIVAVGNVGNVRADPGQLEQVILNLIVNARDAMPHGGTLTCETRNVEIDEAFAAEHSSVQPGPYVLLTISDTGVGMDGATRTRIFEPFFTTKEPGQGTGLGLSTVYGIVTQSGGSIEVDSELGRGTTFRIYLPRVGEAAPADQPVTAEPIVPGDETILLVEDERALRLVATRILEKAGYTVLAAGTGEEALLSLKRHDGPVHLMLTDVVLPGISGREVANRLAEAHPEIKVLYTSGYTDDAILRRGVLEKGTNFIGKPYAVAELTRKVREVLDA